MVSARSVRAVGEAENITESKHPPDAAARHTRHIAESVFMGPWLRMSALARRSPGSGGLAPPSNAYLLLTHMRAVFSALAECDRRAWPEASVLRAAGRVAGLVGCPGR